MNLPINKLTKIFTIILLLSLVLTSMGLNDVFRNDAFVTPFSILLSQTIWNAAKVFFYLLLVLKFVTNKNMLLRVLLLFTIVFLPFSQYLLCPGGLILSVLMLWMFLFELRNGPQIMYVEIDEGKNDHRFSIQKFELLGFFAVCCALFIMQKQAPHANIQKFLCLFCIFHFLFLTNLVGYRFSRG
ncbi:MAG: hypothetical protein ACI8TE_000087 [Francisella sp.]|jgi:hypothetical protein